MERVYSVYRGVNFWRKIENGCSYGYYNTDY